MPIRPSSSVATQTAAIKGAILNVRQAMLTGVHVCTMPYGVMKNLCENTLTAAGTAQFREHTALMTMPTGPYTDW